jgi:hypothetical protein
VISSLIGYGALFASLYDARNITQAFKAIQILSAQSALASFAATQIPVEACNVFRTPFCPAAMALRSKKVGTFSPHMPRKFFRVLSWCSRVAISSNNAMGLSAYPGK